MCYRYGSTARSARYPVRTNFLLILLFIESLLVSNGQIITSSVEENGEITTFHTFLTHLTAHLVIDVRRTSDVRVPLDILISSSGRPSEVQWNIRARLQPDEDFVELVIKNGRNGEWFCGISFPSNENSTRVVGFSIAMDVTSKFRARSE